MDHDRARRVEQMESVSYPERKHSWDASRLPIFMKIAESARRAKAAELEMVALGVTFSVHRTQATPPPPAARRREGEGDEREAEAEAEAEAEGKTGSTRKRRRRAAAAAAPVVSSGKVQEVDSD